MNPRCSCGGRFKSIDPVIEQYDHEYRKTFYIQERLTPGVASWKCDLCGKLQTQRLRVSKKAGVEP